MHVKWIGYSNIDLPLLLSQELLTDHRIPHLTVNANRKPHIVRTQLLKQVKPLVENREALFQRCYPISYAVAQRLLHFSYKHYSPFGCWDPIRVSDELLRVLSFMLIFIDS